MPTTTRIALLFALPATLGAAACDVFKDPEPEPGVEASADGCVDEVTVLAGVDAANALGFTAAEVLDLAVGERVSPMAWGAGLADPLATVEFGPEAGAAELTVTVEYAGGEVRYVKSTPDYGEFDGGYAICNDRLEVDVAVTVRSSGGALDESFVGALRATTPRIATIERSIALADLAGSLALTKVEPAEVSVGDVSLRVGITEDGLFGGASSTVEVSGDGWVGATGLSYAAWPSAGSPCWEGEAPLALESAAAGFNGADVLAAIAAVQPLSLTWGGGAATGLSLALSHDGGPVCAIYQGEGVGTLRFGAEASVVTEDGRWMGAFAVDVTGEVGPEGELARAYFSRYAPYGSTVPAADFEATFGLQGVDLSGFDEGTIDFSGSFEGGAASGRLEVLGVKLHSCPPDANGCAGNDYVSIEAASWGSP